MRAYFRRCFAYDHWANRATLESLKTLPIPPARCVELLGHLLRSEEFLLEALEGRYAAELMERADPSAAECAVLIESLARRWQQYLDRLSEADVAGRTTIRRSSGRLVEHAVTDLLTHALYHAVYHRGQIAAELRARGGEPVRTDVTVFARQYPHP